METNFFKQIANLNITGNVQLTIAKGAQGSYVVSIFIHNEACEDDAKQLIPPLNLRGTADELDSGFFEKIAKPLQAASGLMVNMEVFMEQLEEAKKQSAMEKEKTEKEKKQKEQGDKKYNDAIAKVDELEKAGKYREAWMKVPNPSDYPQQAEFLRKRKTELSDKFSSPGLFDTEQDEETTEQDEETV